MSHMVETMAWAGQTPWHGLGKEVPADLSPEQMMVAAGLDWKVEPIKTYAEIQGQQVYTGMNALVRSTDSRILDVVPETWNPLQNEEAFEFFNDFVKAGDMSMNTAGSLRNGQIVWGLAKVNESFDLFDGDVVDSYLLFTCPHKFGQSIDVRLTPIRVVCNNTITLALGQKVDNMVKVSHRRKFDGDQVKMTLGIASEKMKKYKEMAEFLGNKKASEETMIQYITRVFPSLSEKKEVSKPAQKAIAVIESQPGAKYAEGTFWQAFNAVTFTIDHILGRTQETRLSSAWYGPNRQRKIDALKLAVEMAEAA